jgi:hypothetical protein
MLRTIGWAMAGLWVAGAIVFVRRVPAASLALIASLAAGAWGFAYVRPDGPRGVPFTVARWAWVALLAGGLIGLVATRPHASRQTLRRIAIGLTASAPVVAVAVGLLLVEACPLYVTTGSGLCFHDLDLMGGWITGVAILVGSDLLTVGAIVAIAATQVHPGSGRVPVEVLGDEDGAGRRASRVR